MTSLVLALAMADQILFPNRHLAAPPTPDAVVVVVNGEEVRARDIAPYLWEWRAPDVLEDLIAYRIAAQAAAQAGIEVDERTLEADIDRRLRQIQEGLPAGRTLEEELRSLGFPRSRFYVRLRAEMLLDGLAAASLEPARWVRLSALTFPVETGTRAELDRANAQALEARRELEAGNAWSTVYLKYARSNAPPRYGLQDWRLLETMSVDLRALLNETAPGGYAGPTATERGIELFRLELKGEDADGDELALLRQAHARIARPILVQELRNRARVEIRWPR